MTQKACRECHLITTGNICSKCKTATLSDDFSGLIIVIDPEESKIAKTMETKEKGRYALRVR
ncbi:MAG: DNA-directed RNA polymerase subunit E'' [Candidatus Bathyarchaeota archaeon]|jgi:DNA-directed RNA polymerase subunit E"|nr:MAG: DNA-directed RNA polymerase subunit E'' [Candidatus Bathyarchaeota archaeon]